MSVEKRAWAMWAKSGDGVDWLPLPQHLSDSLAVAGVLWDRWVPDSLIELIRRQTGLEQETAKSLLMFLTGSHDLGKATVTFQTMLDRAPGYEHFSDRLRRAGLDTTMTAGEALMPRFRHEVASGVLLCQWLQKQGIEWEVAQSCANVVDAHHGRASDPQIVRSAESFLPAYPPAWTEVHEWLLDRAAAKSNVHQVLETLRAIPIQTQILLSGLVIMADWIASNPDAFPLEAVADQIQRLEDGLSAVDLTLPWVADSQGASTDELYRLRFGWSEEMAPRPAQAATVDAARAARGPAMIILEAPTGNGKTEAAFAAAEVLAEAHGAGGVMVAAPTMSTANGLFSRFLQWIQRASRAGEVNSLFLAHSRAVLMDEYRSLRFTGVGPDAPSSDTGDVIASQWMSGRKKGILSNFVIGTVDQVLLMALQAKHSMLRHLGLAGKVVIIDEVHSYDTYMSMYLHTALRWLASYGASVILLSATLPVQQKEELASAYREGLRGFQRTPGKRAPISLGDAYPAVTVVSADGISETSIPLGDVEATVTVSEIGDEDTDLNHAVDGLLQDGGCLLVICNTVKRAQMAFTALNGRYPGDVELHHAAFPASERSEREDRLRARLGPGAHRGEGRPLRRIVVATQVAEQSLDIDVDALITDIAPMDLLIQRIGRLHRHQRPISDRPEHLRRPQVLIRGILGTGDADAPEFDGGAEAVYGRKHLLSAYALIRKDLNNTGFQRPHDVAHLVQTAYNPQPPIPEVWSEAWQQACDVDEAARTQQRARAATYRFPEPKQAIDLADLFSRFYETRRSASDSEEFGLAQVRDSSPTLEVIPIVTDADGYRPLTGAQADDSAVWLTSDQPVDSATAWQLATSVLRLPSWVGRNPRALDELIGELELATPLGWRKDPLLKGLIALPFSTALTTAILGKDLLYSTELGLVTLDEDLALNHSPAFEGDNNGR